MSLLLKPVYLLWRIWFYLMMGLPLIIFFPIILVTTLKESWYPVFFMIARKWAGFVMYASGFIPLRKNGVFYEKDQSFMFVANHVSMLDIMHMFYTVKNPFVFVGKKELTKIPVFGFFFKRTSIWVDRGDPKSRLEVFNHAQAKIKKGFSICIFPEGGVPEDESLMLDTFKDGAFRLAIEHQLPIVPLVFSDNKKRFPYTFFSGSIGVCRSYILPTTPVNGLDMKNRSELKQQVRNAILNKLTALSKAE